MQSVAATFGLFIAIFVLSLQHNSKKISSIVSILRPSFMIVSFIVLATLYFNGFVLFIISSAKPSDLNIEILLKGSLFSLILSLVSIIGGSYQVLAITTGFKSRNEKIISIDLDEMYWHRKSDSQRKKTVKSYIDLLENEDSDIKTKIINFFGNVKAEEAIETLIETLNDPVANVRIYSAEAPGEQERGSGMARRVSF
jgi:hypothetical protein